MLSHSTLPHVPLSKPTPPAIAGHHVSLPTKLVKPVAPKPSQGLIKIQATPPNQLHLTLPMQTGPLTPAQLQALAGAHAGAMVLSQPPPGVPPSQAALATQSPPSQPVVVTTTAPVVTSLSQPIILSQSEPTAPVYTIAPPTAVQLQAMADAAAAQKIADSGGLRALAEDQWLQDGAKEPKPFFYFIPGTDSSAYVQYLANAAKQTTPDPDPVWNGPMRWVWEHITQPVQVPDDLPPRTEVTIAGRREPVINVKEFQPYWYFTTWGEPKGLQSEGYQRAQEIVQNLAATWAQDPASKLIYVDPADQSRMLAEIIVSLVSSGASSNWWDNRKLAAEDLDLALISSPGIANEGSDLRNDLLHNYYLLSFGQPQESFLHMAMSDQLAAANGANTPPPDTSLAGFLKHNILDKVGSFLAGIGEQVVNFTGAVGKFTLQLLQHPLGTAENAWDATTNAVLHPLQTWDDLNDAADKFWVQEMNAWNDDPAKVLGRGAFEIGMMFLPIGDAEKLGEAAEAIRADAAAGKIGELAEADRLANVAETTKEIVGVEASNAIQAITVATNEFPALMNLVQTAGKLVAWADDITVEAAAQRILDRSASLVEQGSDEASAIIQAIQEQMEPILAEHGSVVPPDYAQWNLNERIRWDTYQLEVSAKANLSDLQLYEQAWQKLNQFANSLDKVADSQKTRLQELVAEEYAKVTQDALEKGTAAAENWSEQGKWVDAGNQGRYWEQPEYKEAVKRAVYRYWDEQGRTFVQDAGRIGTDTAGPPPGF